MSPPTPAIQVEGLSFSFPATRVLKDVSFDLAPLTSTCIIGPNGGGKTTLMKILLGLLEPERGSVRIFGEEPRAARRRMGYVPQHMQFDPLFPITARESAIMGQLDRLLVGRYSNHSKQRALETLAQVGLADVAQKPFAKLSGGQRQRVLIARALASDPDLLLLDEPTANVDLTVEAQFLDTLESLRGEMAIAVITHDLDLVSRLTDSVLCVNHTAHWHAVADLTGAVIKEIFSGEHRIEHEQKTLHAQGDHSHCKHD